MSTDKIGPQHLRRKAILYVRQSSAHRVLHNRESGALQYAMRDRLTALGFTEIEVIDEDLGRSAAGSVQRSGFERMVAEVCRTTSCSPPVLPGQRGLSSRRVSYRQGQVAATRQMVRIRMVSPLASASLRWLVRGAPAADRLEEFCLGVRQFLAVDRLHDRFPVVPASPSSRIRGFLSNRFQINQWLGLKGLHYGG
jgi:hypothetical protein